MAARIDYASMTPEQRIREYVRIAWPIVERILGGGAAAANERDALAAIGGRSQATAAASADSIARPAVQ